MAVKEIIAFDSKLLDTTSVYDSTQAKKQSAINADTLTALGTKINYTDALTLEEIEASTDLSNKVAAAAAVETIKESLTTIRASSDISDCNVATALLSRYNSGTLNTPYKQGLINATSGILFSTKPANLNYCTQIAIPDSLDHIYIRYNATGGFSVWTRLA